MINNLDGLYWNFHWPLSLKTYIDSHLANKTDDPNSPMVTQPPAARHWLSQPRPNNDETVEVLTIRFKLPLSVSEISFEALRVPVRIEVWYQDRLDNWRQALDYTRIPIALTLSASAKADSWYKFHSYIWPIVAKAVQLRCVRVPDSSIDHTPYVIGIRNTLLRRNVYDRNAGRLPFEDEIDPIGNVISKYIKDWDASRAIDDRPVTFWRSAPQPDHQAVVSLYLDVRAPDGSPQTIDALYLDPVYTNQVLNLYYSNDDTTGTTKLSPITLVPVSDINTQWRAGRGRWDIATATDTSEYFFTLAVGPLVEKDVWFGIEWVPDFDPLDGPPINPVLFTVDSTDPGDEQYWPTIYYDVGAGEIHLKLSNGDNDLDYKVALSPLFVPGDPLRIVVGWTYDPQTVYISVKTYNGTEIGLLEDTSPNLPSQITLDGKAGFTNFRGILRSHIIKMADYHHGSEAYQTNPSVYVSPEPLLVDQNGQIPSSTLDNAIYAVDWTLQTHGSGGSHESFYGNKVWTPIWRDYLTFRGNLYFPQPISMKYLKLEFTNLTEEPYPVYDVGVKTTYHVYPMEVQQLMETKHLGTRGAVEGRRQVIQQLRAEGYYDRRSVNWLNPRTVQMAVDAVFGPTVMPITITPTGPAMSYSELPSTFSSSIDEQIRTEVANPYLYRRNPLDAKAMAQATIAERVRGYYQGLRYLNNAFIQAYRDAFTPWRSYLQDRHNPNLFPEQNEAVWVFPGRTLAMPTSVMNAMIARYQVVNGRKPTVETRLRFMTTSVHRYDTKEVVRDMALAYFAGVREVRPLVANYIDEQDPDAFEFGPYHDRQWTFNNIRQLDTGPISTFGKTYPVDNQGFDLNLANWDLSDEAWNRDPMMGRWRRGSLHITLDGQSHWAHSNLIDVEPGDKLRASCFVAWQDVEATDGEPIMTLEATTYLDGEEVDQIQFADLAFEDWTEHPTSITNEIQWLTIVGEPDGGTFNIALGEEDDDVAYDPDPEVLAAAIQAVLEGFDAIGQGNVEVVWDTDHFVITFVGDLASTDIPPLMVDGTNLTGDDAPEVHITVAQEGHPDVPAWVRVTGTWTVPAGVDQIRMRPTVTEHGTAGEVWIDMVTVEDDNEILGTIYREFVTTSTFSKVYAEFRDSGAVRSDAMWARADLANTNIDEYELAYYVTTIPEGQPAGTWGDSFGTWADSTITWGSPYSEVAITIDSNRIFDGRRALKFARAAGAGEAGIKMLQFTNMVAGALVRPCVVFYKPYANPNTITLRVRRASDGVYIHEETIASPAVGYWYTHKGQFAELPDGPDQVYWLELTTSGDSEDELYVNDLFLEVALVRYFMRLGGSGSFLHDVTPLRYATGAAQVVTTTPVNEFSVQAAILSPKVWLYGCTLTPNYLK